ncbi:hypothetical protein [Streptomyces cavernae]|uniref:hypothetical protein n=1 Tax=Streptomyces cavernae TaxID=2259034 RepID=UPI0012D8B631|nr:hypothetical protein [Streptomyces cavernae]
MSIGTTSPGLQEPGRRLGHDWPATHEKPAADRHRQEATAARPDGPTMEVRG